MNSSLWTQKFLLFALQAYGYKEYPCWNDSLFCLWMMMMMTVALLVRCLPASSSAFFTWWLCFTSHTKPKRDSQESILSLCCCLCLHTHFHRNGPMISPCSSYCCQQRDATVRCTWRCSSSSCSSNGRAWGLSIPKTERYFESYENRQLRAELVKPNFMLLRLSVLQILCQIYI